MKKTPIACEPVDSFAHPRKARAKPVFRTKALEDEIIERITRGETLRAICRLAHMPNWVTVYSWIDATPELEQRFAQARVRGHDAIAADALRIADTPVRGDVVTVTDGVKTVKTVDMLGHRKLQIETRLKLLARWDPGRYGDRQILDHNVSADTAAILMAARKRSGKV